MQNENSCVLVASCTIFPIEIILLDRDNKICEWTPHLDEHKFYLINRFFTKI